MLIEPIINARNSVPAEFDSLLSCVTKRHEVKRELKDAMEHALDRSVKHKDFYGEPRYDAQCIDGVSAIVESGVYSEENYK